VGPKIFEVPFRIKGKKESRGGNRKEKGERRGGLGRPFPENEKKVQAPLKTGKKGRTGGKLKRGGDKKSREGKKRTLQEGGGSTF